TVVSLTEQLLELPEGQRSVDHYVALRARQSGHIESAAFLKVDTDHRNGAVVESHADIASVDRVARLVRCLVCRLAEGALKELLRRADRIECDDRGDSWLRRCGLRGTYCLGGRGR